MVVSWTSVTPRVGFLRMYSCARATAFALDGQLLGAGQRRGVDGRLQLALRVPAEAEVEHERGHPEKHRHRDDDEDEALASLVASSLHSFTPFRHCWMNPLGLAHERIDLGGHRLSSPAGGVFAEDLRFRASHPSTRPPSPPMGERT